ncbi:MAG: hypothetical protein ACM3XS_03480 [Bacteroidota bacterium]
MHLVLGGREVLVTIHSRSELHLSEGTTSRRLLASLLTHDEITHEKVLRALTDARRHGLIATDGRGNAVGRWRVADLPVHYRMDEAGTVHNHLFELAEVVGPEGIAALNAGTPGRTAGRRRLPREVLNPA